MEDCATTRFHLDVINVVIYVRTKQVRRNLLRLSSSSFSLFPQNVVKDAILSKESVRLTNLSSN